LSQKSECLETKQPPGKKPDCPVCFQTNKTWSRVNRSLCEFTRLRI
jgi:hypothetical protein